MKRRIHFLSLMLAVILAVVLLPAGLLATEAAQPETVSATYIDENGAPATVQAIPVTSELTTWGENGKTTWYVVNEDVTIDSRITFNGDICLILADGKTLTVNGDVYSPRNNFTVYGGQADTGTLIVTSGTIGIQTLTVYGGQIHATAEDRYTAISSNADIIVNGGTLVANAGFMASAIESYYGSIVINGGRVEAIGNEWDVISISSDKGIVITGGTVIVTIEDAIDDVCGLCSDYGSIDISGGSVTVTTKTKLNDPNDIAYGIGAASINISGGEINVTAASEGADSYGIYATNSLTVSGGEINVTATSDTAKSYGIYSYSNQNNPLIENSKITATADTYGIFSYDSIIIRNSEITAKATGADGKGIAARNGQDIEISGSTVTAEGAVHGMYAHGKLYIESSTVTAGGATALEGNYAIDILHASTVTLNGTDGIVSEGYVRIRKSVVDASACTTAFTSTVVNEIWLKDGAVVFVGENDTCIDVNNEQIEDCIIFQGTAGTVYSDCTLNTDLIIPAGYTLTVPADTQLIVPEGAALANAGTITVEAGGAVKNEGIIYNSGTITSSVAGNAPIEPVDGAGGGLFVIGGEKDVDYAFNNGIVTILSDKALTLTTPFASADNPHRGVAIQCSTAQETNITLKNLHLNAILPLEITSGTCNLTLEGENSLRTTNGLVAYEGTTLNIGGTGALNITANNGSAIDAGGALNITGGTVTAASESGNGIYAEADITISGAVVNASSNTSGNPAHAAIYAMGELTVENGAKVNATAADFALTAITNITISDSEVTATSWSTSAILADSTLVIENSTVDIAEALTGIYANSIQISESTVNIASGSSAIYATTELEISDSTVNISSEGRGIVSGFGGNALIQNSEVTINSQGAALVVTGELLVSQDSTVHATSASSNAVELTGKADIQGELVAVGATNGLAGYSDINISGTVTATGANYGIYSLSDINISGATVKATGGTHGMYSLADISITDATVKATSPSIVVEEGVSDNSGIFAENEIAICNSDVTAQGSVYGIGALKIHISGSEIRATATATDTLWSWGIAAYADLNGTEDIGGILVIEDSRITAKGNGNAIGASTSMSISGENTVIHAESTSSHGISAKNLEITGGKITATGNLRGINGSDSLTITDAVVDAKGGEYGIYTGANAAISGSEITAKSETNSAIYAGGTLVLENCAVDITESLMGIGASTLQVNECTIDAEVAYQSLYAFTDLEINESIINTTCEEHYNIISAGNLEVNDSEVTLVGGQGGLAAGGGIVISENSTVNVTDISEAAVYAEGLIDIRGDVTAVSEEYGIFSYSNILISGNVEATGDVCGIYAVDSLTVTDGTTVAKGGQGGVYAAGIIVEHPGVLNASSDQSAVISDHIRVSGVIYALGGTEGLTSYGTLSLFTEGNPVIVASSISDTVSMDGQVGVIFNGSEGHIYGNPTIMQDITIPEGYTLIIEKGQILTVAPDAVLTVSKDAAIENNGTIHGTVSYESSYKITFVVDGRIIDEQIVAHGQNADMPAIPRKNGYTQTKPRWDHNGQNITSDLVIHAVYTINRYDVIFKIDGKTVSYQTVEYGMSPDLPKLPEREGYTETKPYWDYNGEDITEDMTIHAVYTPDGHTVTFVADGKTVATQIVEHGKHATLPEIPAKNGYTQTAPTWDDNGENITGDTVITAVYTANKYTITFMIDGTTVDTQIVEHGKDATLPAIPQKDGCTQIAPRWNNDCTNVTSDLTVSAIYSVNTYTVTFRADGVTVATQTVEHGENATPPEIPAKDGFTAAWDKNGEKITADTVISAVYTAEKAPEDTTTAPEPVIPGDDEPSDSSVWIGVVVVGVAALLCVGGALGYVLYKKKQK